MRKYLRTIKRGLKKIETKSTKLIRAKKDLQQFKKMDTLHEFKVDAKDTFFIYEDDQNAASVDGHYFLMDYYMAKRINENKPTNHYDIGSSIGGFIAHLLSAGTCVTLLDIRPFFIEMEGLRFIQADCTNMEGIKDNSLESISSLHAIEHFGLGRYGDSIDPEAWKKALKAIQSKICSGGRFYFAVPVGNTAKICFNAHRIFTPQLIIDQLDEMKLESFAYIHDYKIINVDDLSHEGIANITGSIGDYDCGLFIFKKK